MKCDVTFDKNAPSLRAVPFLQAPGNAVCQHLRSHGLERLLAGPGARQAAHLHGPARAARVGHPAVDADRGTPLKLRRRQRPPRVARQRPGLPAAGHHSLAQHCTPATSYPEEAKEYTNMYCRCVF